MAGKIVQRRIITTLGVGSDRSEWRYKPVIYKFPDMGSSSQTPLLQYALYEVFNPQTKMRIFGTERVEDVWLDKDGDNNPVAYNGKVFLPQEKFNFIKVKDGKSTDELNDLFWTIVKSLDVNPLEDLGESVAPDEIILDVTHGFRIQPMIALAAASYVQSTWLREPKKNMPHLRVVYGAFDAEEDGIAPIWDITEFMRFSQWTEAFSAFQRFGRADDLKALALNLGKAEHQRLTETHTKSDLHQRETANWLRYLGEQASKFADALITNRTEELPVIVEKLQRTLANELGEKWRKEQKFINQLTNALERDAEGLELDELHTVEGMKAVAKRVELLIRFQQYSQAIILIEEALKMYCGILICAPSTKPHDIYNRGAAFVRQKQHEPLGEAVKKARKLAKDIETPRKTLAHAGFGGKAKKQPKSDTLIQIAKDSSVIFRALVDNMPSAGSEMRKREEKSARIFLNFSNHPVQSWPKGQRESAQQRYGTPHDVEGWDSNIRPHAPIREIMEIADGYARQAEELGAKHAFVAGEPTFSMALVACLQSLGIQCYAATSERKKVESKQPDGSIHMRSEYRFAGWREYPDLQRIFDEGEPTS